MNIPALVIDGFLVIFSLSLIVQSYRRGLLRTLLSTAGHLLSCVLAYIGSRALAEACYKLFFRDRLMSALEQAISKEAAEADLPGKISAALGALPKFLQGLLNVGGVSAESLSGQVSGQMAESARALSSSITESVLHPLIFSLLQGVSFLLLFGACMVLVRFVLRMVRGMERLPLVGSLNALLGGLMGVVEAIVVVFVIAVAAKILVDITGGFPWFNAEIVDQTYVFRYFYHFNLQQFSLQAGIPAL